MKWFKSLVTLLVLAIGLFSLSSVALAGEQDFVIANETGLEIINVFVSPTGSDVWSDDKLGEDVTIPTGSTGDILFAPNVETEYWDIMVENETGWKGIARNYNLIKLTKLTLHYDAASDTVTADPEYVE